MSSLSEVVTVVNRRAHGHLGSQMSLLRHAQKRVFRYIDTQQNRRHMLDEHHDFERQYQKHQSTWATQPRPHHLT